MIDWHNIQSVANQVGMVINSNHKGKQLVSMAYKIARKNMNVLVTGETGTGKEVMARFIHAASSRADSIFIPVNCGAINESLLESELFGHEKGAFTGAVSTRKGIFELARKGTLFLDELADAARTTQVKLLRVIETGEFLRVGGEKTITSNARIIAATNADIESLVQDKKFREDLFYRLDVVRLELMPLRQRLEDIPALVQHFAAKFTGGGHTPAFPDSVLNALMSYPWHGNIRELQNVVQQILAGDIKKTVALKDLPPKVLNHAANYKTTSTSSPAPDIFRLNSGLTIKTGHAPTIFLPRSLREVEREHIEKTLAFFEGNVSMAARALGLSRATLYRKIKQ